MWFPRMDTMVEEQLKSCLSCQAATESNVKEPILPTEIPTKPWNTLCTDIFGPLPTGEYLVLVQDLHSRFPEVAITHSTSAEAVIPAVDKILAAYGTPEVMGSDNGPPYNLSEFMKFAKKLGFVHRKITPLAPWANGTAERFMKNLAKVLQVAKSDKKNWRHELTKYLRAYRATPHSMTGVSPAALLFNGRPYGTNLPSIRTSMTTPEQQKAISTDGKKKGRMEAHANKGAQIKHTTYEVGDQVLLKQQKRNKLDTAYEKEPYTVEEVKGRQITARNHIHQVCRHANLFKKLVSRPELDDDMDMQGPRPERAASTNHNGPTPAPGLPSPEPAEAAPSVASPSQAPTTTPSGVTDDPEAHAREEEQSSQALPSGEPRRSKRTGVRAPARYPEPDGVKK